MPVTNWNTTTIDGDPYLVIDMAKLRVPLNWDASSRVFLAVAAPDGVDGDALFSYPALVSGDPGPAATLDGAVVVSAVLEYDDPTPDSASWTELSPGVYQYTTTQRKGPPGSAPVVNIIGADDLTGTPTPNRILVVNATSDGMVYASQKVGDWYYPATINAQPSGQVSYVLTTIPVGAQDFDWRPDVDAQTSVTASGGTDVITDLVARLVDDGGNELARCFGMTDTERLILAGGPPPGSPDGWDRVAAGVPVNVVVMTERRSGTNTVTTSTSTTRARVRVCPIP